MIKNVFLVGLGGAIGSVLRYIISQILKNQNFPYSTLIINITGSMIIGLVFGLSMKYANWDAAWKTLLTAGFCGGFTTFSAFSYENILMLQQGKIGLSLIYIFSSVIAGITATYIGLKLLA